MHANPNFSTQDMSWEDTDPSWAHITDHDWYSLRQSKFWSVNWESNAQTSPYHLVETCLRRGLSPIKTKTVIMMWHRKHGHTFNEPDYVRLEGKLYDKTRSKVREWQAQEYWAEVRRIQSDPKAKDHSKMRVSYYLTNTTEATAREISNEMGIAIKNVRNALASLQGKGKIYQVSTGVYQAVQNSRWDRHDLEDHAHSIGDELVSPNSQTKDGMMVWNFTKDVVELVPSRHAPFEWVMNSSGRVVVHGSPVVDKVSASEDLDVDYFARLDKWGTANEQHERRF